MRPIRTTWRILRATVLVVLAFTALFALALELRSPQTWICDAQRISKGRVVNWAVVPGAVTTIVDNMEWYRNALDDLGERVSIHEVDIQSRTAWRICGLELMRLPGDSGVQATLIQVPLAGCAVLAGFYPGIVLGRWLYRRHRRYRRVRAGLCFTCGYNLKGSVSQMCSECGRALWQFGPAAPGHTREAQPDTSNIVRENPPAKSLWPFCGGAPSRWTWPAGLLLAGGYVHACSVPGGLWAMYGRAAYLIAPIALAAILLMLVDFVGRILSVGLRRLGHSARSRLRRWTRACRWLALPACLALMVSAGASLWPLRVRFEWSREAFEAELRDVPRGDRHEQGGRRVGLYDVHRIIVSRERASTDRFLTPYDDLVFFQTGHVGMDAVGFTNWTSDHLDWSCWSRRLTPRWLVDQRVD